MIGPGCKGCKSNVDGKCKRNADRWKFCDCGCGKAFQIFTKTNAKRPKKYYETKPCTYRCRKKKKEFGMLVPEMWVPCAVCGDMVPIFADEMCRMYENRAVVCCLGGPTKCMSIVNSRGRAERQKYAKKYKKGDYNAKFAFKATVCHPGGGRECADYMECFGPKFDFSLGLRRYRATGGECYKAPPEREYGLKAISIATIYGF